jgi:hypothetical protein
VKKSKKWTLGVNFERLSCLQREKKIFISPENGKNLLLLSREKNKRTLGKKEKFPHSILPL